MRILKIMEKKLENSRYDHFRWGVVTMESLIFLLHFSNFTGNKKILKIVCHTYNFFENSCSSISPNRILLLLTVIFYSEILFTERQQTECVRTRSISTKQMYRAKILLSLEHTELYELA